MQEGNEDVSLTLYRFQQVCRRVEVLFSITSDVKQMQE